MRRGLRVDVGDRDPRRARDARDFRAHGADRAVSQYRDRLSREVRDLRGVDRVAQGVQESADARRHDVPVERDDVVRGNHHVLREAAVLVDPQNARVLADMPLSRPARPAVAAGDVHLGRDVQSFAQVLALRLRAEPDDLAAELVSIDARGLHDRRHRLVPLVDVTIGSADRGRENPDEHLSGAGTRHWHRLDLRSLPPRQRLRLDDSRHASR